MKDILQLRDELKQMTFNVLQLDYIITHPTEVAALMQEFSNVVSNSMQGTIAMPDNEIRLEMMAYANSIAKKAKEFEALPLAEQAEYIKKVRQKYDSTPVSN